MSNHPSPWTRHLAWVSTLVLLLTGVATGLAQAAEAAPTSAPPPAAGCAGQSRPVSGDPPVLAHYYMWFTASSWNRAKKDYPTVGRYSSDQTSVMAQQVMEARSAGIDGFMVSWKSTDTLNSRLAALRNIAAKEDFKLGITYEAQDFNRSPLPVAQVRSDLQTFADAYASDPVFQVLGSRPVVAISGTWHYSEADLQSIIAPVASRLAVLATEKSVKGYQRVSPAVAGELYYWSSADPEQTTGYDKKLRSMSDVVHQHCGIWVAPVAPGFDARDVGGTQVISRRNGSTLRSAWQAASESDPDMIGVISWNEYSENTHVEPSTAYGTKYLDVLRDLTGAPPPAPGGELDSSSPAGEGSTTRAALGMSAAVGFVLFVTGLGIWRRRRVGPG